MKQLTLYLLFFITALNLNAQKDDDPLKYLDDGGIATIQNNVRIDFAKLLEPSLTIGYERILSDKYLIGCGISIYNHRREYKLGSDWMDTYEYDKYSYVPKYLLSGFYVELKHITPFKEKQLGLGYRHTAFEDIRMQDIYVSINPLRFKIKHRIVISLDAIVGVRLLHFHDIEVKDYEVDLYGKSYVWHKQNNSAPFIRPTFNFYYFF